MMNPAQPSMLENSMSELLAALHSLRSGIKHSAYALEILRGIDTRAGWVCGDMHNNAVAVPQSP